MRRNFLIDSNKLISHNETGFTDSYDDLILIDDILASSDGQLFKVIYDLDLGVSLKRLETETIDKLTKSIAGEMTIVTPTGVES